MGRAVVMQFVIVDEDGYLQTLVNRIKKEGYEVLYYPKRNADISKMKPDVLLANTVKPLHHLNNVLVGITQPVFNMITDGEYMQKVMKVWGVNMPHSYTPDEFKPKKDTRYILKTPSLSPYYSEAEDARVVIDMLLQHKVDVNITEVPYKFEIEVEAWFNSKEFMPPYYILDEVIMHSLPHTILYDKTLRKMEGCLKKINFKGAFSMRVGVCEEEVYTLSLDCKFRPMAFEAMMHPEEYLRAVVTGSDASMYGGWVEQTPVVSNVFNHSLKLPVIGINEQNRKHIWLNGNEYASTGGNPTLGYITARGENVRECNRRITRTRSNITIPYTIPHPLARYVKEKEKMLKEWKYV